MHTQELHPITAVNLQSKYSLSWKMHLCPGRSPLT